MANIQMKMKITQKEKLFCSGVEATRDVSATNRFPASYTLQNKLGIHQMYPCMDQSEVELNESVWNICSV